MSDTDTTEDTRPILTLDRNNAGDPFIGLTELDAEGYGTRAAVLSSGPHVADRIMARRYEDMLSLMGDNVQGEVTDDFLTGYTPTGPELETGILLTPSIR